jgi:ATP-dependent helicase YprA (DUF1998 family)
MLLDVRRLVGPDLAERVSAYKSGYRADERARIEAGLRSGRLRGVVSTNALELGIDVGSLDLAVLAGYPGSMRLSFHTSRIFRGTRHSAARTNQNEVKNIYAVSPGGLSLPNRLGPHDRGGEKERENFLPG